MRLPKIITVVGARPQFIKAAILTRQLAGVVEEHILHTGQHYDHLMSDALFKQLEIKTPTWHLNCNNSSHGAMTATMLMEIEKILQEQKPSAVLVYGDTNSTLASTLAATKLHIPIWHVEAGVRSFNKKMPEEINRIITDRVSDIHLAPSETAVQNLLTEGIARNSIHNVGDIMYDLFLESRIKAKEFNLPFSDNFLLLTLHRAENFKNEADIGRIFTNLNALSKYYKILFPVHPRVTKILNSYNFNISENILLRPPLDYFEMIYALTKCYGVITDSGGLQKEAFYAGKPCVTIRDETEWVELVNAGWNALVPPSKLCDNQQNILDFFACDFSKKQKGDFYGIGNACQKIKGIIQEII